ncbi:MAG: hypothetical protein AAFY65_13015 [Pseudomonadota bacterium]
MKISKIVATLPGTLDADTVYLVRVDTGFDIFATDNTGTVAYAHNAVLSKVSGITGATKVSNIVGISQAAYDALGAPDPGTLYLITD